MEISMSNEQESAGFYWTGHPFIDFGIATLMAWCDLNGPDDKPEQLTVGQLQDFAKEAEDDYFAKPDLFKSVMLCFGSNFLNPSWSEQQRRENIQKYLLGILRPIKPELEDCTFFKRPSVDVIARDAFPLLMGRGPINFYPGGEPGLAVSGQTMTVSQALIFGALRSQGKLLIIEADDKNLLRDVVQDWVGKIQTRIQLSKQGQEMADLAPPKTALIGTLERLEKERRSERRVGFGKSVARYYGSATIYHFSNSGQGPSLELYSLPAPILDFIQVAQTPDYNAAWVEIRRRWWPKPKAGKKVEPLAEDYEPSPDQQLSLSNRFFNELFSLPQGATKFVRMYFLGTMRALVTKTWEREGQQQFQGGNKIHALWRLTELLMKEVLGVQAERIEAIKQLGDRLASITQHDPTRYKQFLQVRRNWPEIRRLIRYISRREMEQGQPPVVSLEQFLTIFEMGEEADYVDWGLAWDLVLIRLMEKVYEYDPAFLQKHPDAAATESEEAETGEPALA
jgi:CRISPR-associated protein Cst1